MCQPTLQLGCSLQESLKRPLQTKCFPRPHQCPRIQPTPAHPVTTSQRSSEHYSRLGSDRQGGGGRRVIPWEEPHYTLSRSRGKDQDPTLCPDLGVPPTNPAWGLILNHDYERQGVLTSKKLWLEDLRDHTCQVLPLPQRGQATCTGSPSSKVTGLTLLMGNPRVQAHYSSQGTYPSLLLSSSTFSRRKHILQRWYT